MSVPSARPAPAAPAAGTALRLKPRQARYVKQPGCLGMLGGPMAALGLWLIAKTVLIDAGPDVSLWQIAAGGLLAVAGLSVIVGRMRQTMAAAAPPPELTVPEGQVLIPGTAASLDLRQPGPARLGRITVTAVCERRYTTQVAAPDSPAVSTVEASETLESVRLFDESGIVASKRNPFTRTVPMTIPHLAKPSGPTLAGGVIVWYLDVTTTSARGTVVHDVFDVNVVRSDSEATMLQPGPPEVQLSRDVSAAQAVGVGIGCLGICVAFLLVGPTFLYLYFSDAATKRGNPVMGLVAGVVFSALGLLGIWMLVSGRRKRG